MAPLPPGFQLEPRKPAALPPGFQLERSVAPAPAAPVRAAPAQPAMPVDDFDPLRDLPLPYTPDLPPDTRVFQPPAQPDKRAPEAGPGRALDIAFQGLRQGAGELLGFPVDMSAAALNLGAMGIDAVAPGDQSWMQSKNPIGGSAQINSAVEGIMPGEPFSYDEMTDVQRLGFEGNRFGVQSLLPSGVLSNPVVRQALGKLSPALAPRVEALSRPYTAGANAVNDTIAGVGAGTGYGAYDMYTPEPVKEALGPMGDVISSMGGAVGANLLQNVAEAGARTVAGAGSRAAGGQFDTTLPQNPDGSFVRNKDADVAALYTREMASNPQAAADTIGARANTMRGNGPEAAIPSSGILSDDPGLIAYEKGFRLDPSLHKEFVANQQATEGAALDSAKRIAPETAVGRQFTNAIEAQDAAQLNEARQRVSAAETDVGSADQRNMALTAELTAKRGGQVPASERLDPIVANRLMEDQSRKNSAFDAIDPEGTVPRSIDPMLERVKSIEASAGPLDDPANLPRGVMDRVKSVAETDGTISFRDLNAARPELAGQIAKARKAGDYALADNLTSIKQTIDDEAVRLADEGGEAGVRAQQAMEEYAKFAAVWNKGPGDAATTFRKDFNQDRFNRTTTPPSQTAGRFLQKGQPERAASLRRILDNNPAGEEGRRASADFLAADLAEAPGVVRTNGTLDPAAIERWAQKWGDEALDLAPDFRAQLNGLIVRAGQGQADSSQLATTLKEAQSALRDAEVNKGAIARVLGKDPVNAVSGILSSGDSETAMRQIVERISGNDSALDGLKASVREYLMERATTSAIQKIPGGENPLSFAKLDDLFKAHENALAEVFSPAEMNSLRASHQFLAPLKNLEMKAVVGSQTSANERLWEQVSKPIEVALKLRYGVLKGGGLMRTLGLWRQMMPNGDAAAVELIERMWFDPDLAQHLLTREVDQVGSARYNAKLIRLLSYGAGARDLNEPDDAPTVEN